MMTCSSKVLLCLTACVAAAATPSELDRKLFDSCGRGEIEQVLMLLEQGARADAVFEEGETSLHVAGIKGITGIAEALLAAGADPNVAATGEHSLQFAPLHWWVYSSMPKEQRAAGIAALLGAGAKASAVVFDEEGSERTAVDIVQSLIGALGAEADADGRFADMAALRAAGGLSIKELRNYKRAAARLTAARERGASSEL